MKSRILLMGLMALLLASAPVLAASDARIEETIGSAMAQRRRPSQSWWRSLGASAPRVIRRMIEESRSRYYKVRLIAALGNFGSRKVGAYLKELALSTTHSKLRRAAIRALGRSQGMREERFLARQLQSSNPHTRIAAAEALQATGHPKAERMVENYLKHERSPWVLARLRD